MQAPETTTPAAPGKLRASIVIPTLNRAYVLWRVVECLLAQTVPQREWELVIVDDGGTDNTREMLARYEAENPEFRLIYYWQENRGPAKARNEGVRRSSADIVCVLDSDALPAPDWLEEILKGYGEDPLLAGVGGRIHTHKSSGIINDYNQVKKYNEVPGGYASGTITFLMTGSMSHRRDVLLKVGGFNELYPHFGDDNEMGERVRLLGYHYAYNEKSEADHLHRDTFESLLRRFYWLGHGCYDMVMDTETRLCNRSRHRVFFWLLYGFYGRTLLGLLKDLPRRMREPMETPWRRLIYWALDVLVEKAAMFGTIHFYVSRFVLGKWDKSLYPKVYAEGMGLKEQPCPACGSSAREKLFYACDREYADDTIYEVSRCASCGHAYLRYPPPNKTPVQPSALPQEKWVKALEAALPLKGKVFLPQGDESLAASLVDKGFEVTGQPTLGLDAVLVCGEASDVAAAGGMTLKDALSTWRDLLKPGGALLLEAVNPDSQVSRALKHQTSLNLPRSREWADPVGWTRLLETGGFEVQALRTFTPPGAAARAIAGWWKEFSAGGPKPPEPSFLQGQLQEPVFSKKQLPERRVQMHVGAVFQGIGALLERWQDAGVKGERILMNARRR